MDPQNPIQQPTQFTPMQSGPVQSMPPVKQRSSFPWIKVILIVIVIGIIFGGLGYYLGMNTNKTSSSSLSNSLNSSGTQNSVNPPSSNITPILTPAPTTDPTANWKTYTSKENDFSFKYPPLWEVKDNSSTSIIYVSVSPINKDKKDQFGIYPMGITFGTNLDIKDNMTQTKYDLFKNNVNKNEVLKTNNQIKFLGISTTEFVIENTKYEEKYRDLIIDFSIEKKWPSFSIVQRRFDETPVEDQILSTFKFTEQTQTGVTGRKVCQTDSDCSTNESCMPNGAQSVIPEENQKHCWPKGILPM